MSNVEADWTHPGFREFFERLGEHRTVIRYDRVGAGLSDRTRESVDLQDEVNTLSDLIDHLECERAVIFGVACGGPPAIEYARVQPDRVSELVLFGSFVRGTDVGPPSLRDAVMALVRAHWGMGASAMTDLFAPGLDASDREAMTKLQRQSATADVSADLLALTFDMDVAESAESLDTRSLVLHRKGDRTIPHRAGLELASSLPNATLKTLDGSAHVPWFGNISEAVEAILGFLGVAASQTTAVARSLEMERQGDVWSIWFEREVVHLKASRGLDDLALLLASPGQEIHAAQLYAGADVRLDDSDELLDEEALASFRKRLAQIEEALGDAEELGKVERADALRSEREALGKELRAAVGKGGRKRKLNDPSERARKAVTARIRASIRKISEAHPRLGEHLKTQIKTGVYCSYGTGETPAWAVR